MKYTKKQIKTMSVEEFANKVFSKCQAAKDFLLACGLDMKTGESNAVPMSFGNGGTWIRADGPLARIFNIHCERIKSKIVSVRLIGYAPQSDKHTRYIPICVKKYFESKRKSGYCAIGAEHATPSKRLEIDHRCGRYTLDREEAIAILIKEEYDPGEIHNYQVLCKGCNDWKREQCKRCKKTGKRFDARIFVGEGLGWHYGFEKYNNSCKGCFLYHPRNWRKDYFNPDFLEKTIPQLLQSQNPIVPDENEDGDIGSSQTV